MFKLFILSLVLAGAYAGGKNKCPWAMGKYPLDEMKMVGHWNVVASTNNVVKEGLHCAKFEYQVTKDSHVMAINALTKEGKPIKSEILAQPLFGKEKGGLMMAVWKKEDGTYTTVMKHSIVATDYENYAVFIACKPVFDEKTMTFTRHLKAAILSRKESLSQETMDVLMNVLSGYDVDISTIMPVENTSC